MPSIETAGMFRLGRRDVRRMGYGAMQLAGPHVFGPPKDRAQCIAVLREAVAKGVDHIDTSDFYGPHVTNAIIREALHPYHDDLTLVTKVGAVRGDDGSWNPAQAPEQLVAAVNDNRRNLDRDIIDVVNLRVMGGGLMPEEGSIAARVEPLAKLQASGVIGAVGLSNVTPTQVAEARGIVEIACIQNLYNIANRGDDALIDELAAAGIAYVPYFPLGGFTPLQSDQLAAVAERLGRSPQQVALAWLLARSPNILLIPGTSSLVHLRENLAAAEITLSPDDLTELSAI